MSRKLFQIVSLLLIQFSLTAGDYSLNTKMLPGEKWWGGIDRFDDFPTVSPYDDQTVLSMDLHSNYNNHAVPMFLSSKGRYIWSDSPFKICFDNGEITIDADSEVILEQAGVSLRDAYMKACSLHFPPSGRIPAEEFISAPQYNTWIELTYNQNQTDILKYAHSIVDNGFPSGAVIMVDDNWQKYYGNFDFKPERFSDPMGMCNELHRLGFKIMLWVCPFVSPDSPEYRELRQKGYLIKQKGSNEPYISQWWNGYSAIVDMSNPGGRGWFVDKLKMLQEKYGVDGFKLDAGDSYSYPVDEARVYDSKSYGTLHSELWASLFEDFPYHEFRASWKTQNQPVVLRLHDKDYSWSGVQSLIPSILAASMEGHLFVCPDMIGGGQWTCFIDIDQSKMDQDLIVRSCQIHAYMPMMQFSVAPWRVLDEKHLAICRDYSNIHKELSGYLLEQCRQCAASGEPIVRPMDYSFPGQGMEECTDQFMLGDKYLMAPVVTPGYQRSVKLPEGSWVDETGKKYKGGRTYVIDVPIERVPVFHRNR